MTPLIPLIPLLSIITAARADLDVTLRLHPGDVSLERLACRGSVRTGGRSTAVVLAQVEGADSGGGWLEGHVAVEPAWYGWIQVACDGAAPLGGWTFLGTNDTFDADFSLIPANAVEGVPQRRTERFALVRVEDASASGLRPGTELAWKVGATAWGVLLLGAAGFLRRRGDAEPH